MIDLTTNLNAQERGWGDPDAPGFYTDNIVMTTGPNIAVPVNKGVAVIYAKFFEALNAIYPIAGDSNNWGYDNRNIAGSNVKSNHSWGLAVDIHSDKNPINYRGQVITDMPAAVGPLANTFGLRWGGNYTGTTKDPMHFEFQGTPDDAAALTATLTEVDTMPMSTQDWKDMGALADKIITHSRNDMFALLKAVNAKVDAIKADVDAIKAKG